MLDSEPGTYVFTAMNIVTNCVDSILINLIDDGIPDLDTVWVEVFESQTESICLNESQLAGVIDSLTNICATNATNNTSTVFNQFPVMQDDLCIDITGINVGLDQLCMVLCDNSGLCDTTIVMVQVRPRELIIYNGVSPNDDGINDHLIIENIELFPNNKIQIFNRWGTRVYKTKSYRNDHGWYGTFEGNDLPDGPYFYMVDDGEGGMYTGYLFLQR
jgi:gliding motility-associated-like protein